MNKKFDFYFDFISPYSYLAHKQIDQIKKKTNIEVIYKPILLGGLHGPHLCPSLLQEFHMEGL